MTSKILIFTIYYLLELVEYWFAFSTENICELDFIWALFKALCCMMILLIELRLS